MDKLLQELKDKVINHLKRDGGLDKPYVGKGTKTFTKQDIIDEIENTTEDGLEFMSGIVVLSLDLFDRGKEDIDNHEKL